MADFFVHKLLNLFFYLVQSLVEIVNLSLPIEVYVHWLVLRVYPFRLIEVPDRVWVIPSGLVVPRSFRINPCRLIQEVIFRIDLLDSLGSTFSFLPAETLFIKFLFVLLDLLVIELSFVFEFFIDCALDNILNEVVQRDHT